MSGWIVYSKDGSIERCKLKSLEYGGTAMGERAVTATFDYHSEVAFEVFDYIEYRGERFELEAVPTVKKLSSFEYQYELRFVSLKYELERCEMRDLVPSDNGVVYPTPLTFSFTGDVRYLTDRIQACLDAMYGADVWKIIIADGTSSEEKNITIAQQNCWNVLALVNSTYGLSFYIKGRTITIGGEQPLVSHTFEYGKGNGLYEIERASDTETGIVTKLRAYGSTRNLDYSYPKKPEWSDSVLPVSFALSPLRLMLPSFKTDGKTDYVLADEAAIAKYGIREASMVYDDIYPSITGATYNGQAIDEIKAVDAVDESQKTFVVYLHELGFDLEEHLTTSDAQISMKSGALQGYTFTISSIEKQTGGYKITLGKNSLENSEESGAYVPGVNWNMKAGDKFVLLNILMPQKYIRDAENRLLARANEYLAQYSKTNFSYNIGLHDKFLIQNPSVYNSLIEGSKLKVYDKGIGIDEEITIQSITITENLEDDILPQVKVTLNNEPSASTLDRIQGKLNEVAAETAANGFTTQSEIMAQYRRKLDKPFFDKLFVAIDANGNEIASTDVITPIAYIKAKYHVASVGGFTMYAMDKDTNVPSLASGLPFDGRTIWYNPETNQIEVIGGTGGGSGEVVSNFWDLSGIPSWITNTKPKYTYSEIEGTPDLTKYALASQIPSLSGYATESWVLQKNYATKATTLSGYGITDAYTKRNVDDLLLAYVTLGGTQTITGEKNFTGGLKVNGSPIYYDTDKKYWKLEGDLLVTGGVTMYGSDSSFTPSTIMDAIAVDGTTISKSGGVLKVIGGTGGGVADSVAWVNITGKPTWIGSSKPTYSYSEVTGAISTTELQNYLTQNSYLNVTSGDNRYLKLSGGTLSGDIVFQGGYLRFTNSSGSFLGAYNVNDSGEALYLKGSTWNRILHSGNYSNYALPLSGGTLDGTLAIKTTAVIPLEVSSSGMGYKSYISYRNGTSRGEDMGCLGFYGKNTPSFKTNSTDGGKEYKLLHENNYSSYALPLSGGTINSTFGGLEIKRNNAYASAIKLSNTSGVLGYIGFNDNFNPMLWNKSQGELGVILHSGNIGSYNAGSATKLQTARTIWGQSFDGTGNVSGNLNLAYNKLYIGDGSDNYYIGWGPNQCYVYQNYYGHYFTTKGEHRLTIDGSGSVGIGTTNPQDKLHVNGNGIFNGCLDITGAANYAEGIRIHDFGGISSLWFGAVNNTGYDAGMWGITVNDNGMRFRGTTSTTGTSVSDYMNIIHGGNVGIGTDSPSYKLHVEGTMYGDLKMKTPRTIWGQSFDGTGNIGGDIYLAIGGSTYNIGAKAYFSVAGRGTVASIQGIYTGVDWGATNYAKGALVFSTYNSDTINTAMYINYLGNVGIGTTNPQATLSVYGNIDLFRPNTSSYGGAIGFNRKSMVGGLYNTSFHGFQIHNQNGNLHFFIERTNTYQATAMLLKGDDGFLGIGIENPSAKLHVSGDILATGAMTFYSMRALKNVVDERGLSLTELSTIKPTRYTWKDGRDNRLHFGGIADDIQQVLPEVVYKTSDGILTMDYGNAAFAVASSLIKPVVDHEKRIAMLEKENKELRNEVERLKSA